MDNIKTPFWKSTWFIVLMCLFIPPVGIALLWINGKCHLIVRIILTVVLGIYSIAFISGMMMPRAEPQVITNTKQVNNYMTTATWADTSNYCFAVEVESYDGDIFQSGEYRFYPDMASSANEGIASGKTPIIWDVYASDNLYKNDSELKKSELIGYVGGIEKAELTKELKPGQYVYIKYNKALGDPTGVLQIDKIN